jgi:hypothetical protein
MLVPRFFVSSAYGSTNIESLTAATSRVMSCADSWQVTATWAIHNPNNTLYSLSLYLVQPSSTLLLSNQTCASGNYVYETNMYGNPTFVIPYNTTNMQFEIRLIQRSNSSIVQSLTSNVVFEQWTTCPP